MSLSCKARVLPFVAAATLLASAGCAVGPNFKKPAAPDGAGYTKNPLNNTVATANVAGRRPELCQWRQHFRGLVELVSFRAAQ